MAATPSESSKIKAVGMVTLIHRYLQKRGFSSVLEVSLMEPLVNLRPYVVLRMSKRDDQDPWAAMDALLDSVRRALNGNDTDAAS